MRTTYPDHVVCDNGHECVVNRRFGSAGRIVATRCKECGVTFYRAAGPVPENINIPKGPTSEKQVENRLVRRVEELGGEVRKVQWIGRVGAPDRLVMLPERQIVHPRPVADPRPLIEKMPPRAIWVELKAPGKAATFPRTAHERAQHREHGRMRAMGQRVEVVDSFERIEEILK